MFVSTGRRAHWQNSAERISKIWVSCYCSSAGMRIATAVSRFWENDGCGTNELETLIVLAIIANCIDLAVRALRFL